MLWKPPVLYQCASCHPKIQHQRREPRKTRRMSFNSILKRPLPRVLHVVVVKFQKRNGWCMALNVWQTLFIIEKSWNSFALNCGPLSVTTLVGSPFWEKIICGMSMVWLVVVCYSWQPPSGSRSLWRPWWFCSRMALQSQSEFSSKDHLGDPGDEQMLLLIHFVVLTSFYFCCNDFLKNRPSHEGTC